MIDMRNVNSEERNGVFFCPDCEARYKTRVEISWKHRGPGVSQVKSFLRRHEACGNLEERLDAHCGGTEEECEWNTVKIRAIYEENPGIKFDEVRRIYRGEKHEETKDDVEGSNVDRDGTEDQREFEQCGTDDEVERVFG